jgi:hypothetical protein
MNFMPLMLSLSFIACDGAENHCSAACAGAKRTCLLVKKLHALTWRICLE